MATTDRISGLEVSQALKAPVKAATTANITLSAAQTIDGVSCVAGDRVLVKDQTTGTEDGIYLCQTGSWARAKDWNGSRDATEGTLVTVKGGTINNDTIWRSTATDDPYVIDTVSPTFAVAQFEGPAGGMRYKFDSSTTTTEDPGDGDFRLNNATVASATVITFSDNSGDIGSPDMSPFIITWDDSTNLSLRGHITIQEMGSPDIFAIFTVNAGVTDGTTYIDVPVAYVTGAGSFTAGNSYLISFVRTGDIGAPDIQFDFDTSTTMGDPTGGNFRLNNATVSSVTQIAVADVTSGAGNPDVSDFIVTWDDSTNSALRGTIVMFNNTSLGEFAIFSVTGAITDNADWLQIPVAYVDHNGDPAASDTFTFAFSRTGDLGAATGMQMKWDTSTDDADQGAGTIWINGGGTVLYLDDVEDAGGASINSWVDSWDDSTHGALRGTVTLTDKADNTTFAVYNVTGAVTSASTYSKVAVTLVTSNNTFSADDKILVAFGRTGDDGGGLVAVVNDTTPQLGGMLDVNGQAIGDGTLELLTFTEDASAVNHINIENEATGSGPILSSTGDDTNVDLRFQTKGDGVHNFADAAVRSGQTTLTSTTNSVAIDLADNQYYYHLLTENTTLANPSNIPFGGQTMEFAMFVDQNSTAYTLGFGTFYNGIGSTLGAIGTGTGVKCRLDGIVRSSTWIDVVISNGAT